MEDYESILQTLKYIIEGKFGVLVEKKKSYSVPIRTLFGDQYAINCVYFLLELLKQFHIQVSNDMMEEYANWSIYDMAHYIMHCLEAKSVATRLNRL